MIDTNGSSVRRIQNRVVVPLQQLTLFVKLPESKRNNLAWTFIIKIRKTPWLPVSDDRKSQATYDYNKWFIWFSLVLRQD